MIKAFVFGKFLPFHEGHEAMIRFALTKADVVSVLVCASDREILPGEIRKRWVEASFPNYNNVEVLVVDYKEDELPNSSIPSKSISEIWAGVFTKLLPEHSLLITSEPYGDYVAEYMRIQHIPFDIPKKLYPVSATAVRTDLLNNWNYLPAAVQRDLVVKVVIVGTESTGKSTLTEKLAGYFQCNKVLEAGRDLIPDSNAFTMNDLYAVAKEHAHRITEAANGSSGLVIIDTDIHITRSYGRFTFNEELVVSDAVYNANKADLYLYLNNDVDFIQDGTRLNKEVRDQLDASHRQVLMESKIPFVEVTGNWEARFRKAVEQIKLVLAEKGEGYRY